MINANHNNRFQKLKFRAWTENILQAKASQDPCTTHLRTLWNNVLSNCMLVFNSKSSSDIKDFGASPSDIYHKGIVEP